MSRRTLYLMAGIVLGIIAVFMINSYIQQREQTYRELLRKKGLKEVVIAKVDIPQGTKITKSMIALARLPEQKVSKNALIYPESAIGKIALVDILKGQQILSSQLRMSYQGKTLSTITPQGKRAVTISLDKVSSMAGMLSEGDRVDIIGIFPYSQTIEGKTYTQKVVVPMFEDVLVLSVGQKKSVSKKGRKSMFTQTTTSSPTTITLALLPEEANLLLYALEIGKIKLLLRSPLDDRKLTRKEPITMDKLWEKLLSLKKEITPPPPPPPPKEVEIYKGTQKTEMILEK